MKLNKAFKFRIYPNRQQEELLQKTFGCCRFIYNQMLSDKIEYYKETKQLLKNTPAQYKDEFTFLKEVDSQALAFEQLHLQTAYRNFFRNPKTGFPKFKSKKFDKKTYTTSYVYINKELNQLKLGKVGIVKCKFHRQIPDNYTIKSATISQKASGKYYISILTEYEIDIPKKTLNLDKSIGLDYSSHDFYVDNQGNRASYPKFYRLSQEKLAKEQRKLSKMKLHSNNYQKQKIKVSKILESISNQRKDFIEKLSTQLVNTYDIICIENLNLQNIAQSLQLGKSTNDNGFGMFKARLEQKLSILGKRLIKIDKWTPTSIVCSDCGAYHKDIVKSLSIREWTCPDCGTHHDRDVNAAKNILKQGLNLILNN